MEWPAVATTASDLAPPSVRRPPQTAVELGHAALSANGLRSRCGGDCHRAGGGFFTGFRWLEDWTLDLRLIHARTVEEPPGDQVRLVAIDDASLDTIGRWPWPRERIAMALDETARAGARVAVFDVLFLEPEEGTAGDAKLAAAMGRLKTVVAVSVRGDKVLDAVWDSAEGQRSLTRFTDAVRKGVDRDARVLVDEAALREPFRSRVLERPAAFKSLAAWMALDALSRSGALPKDLPAFVSVMLGGGADAARVGAFGERPLLERAWRRGRAGAASRSR